MPLNIQNQGRQRTNISHSSMFPPKELSQPKVYLLEQNCQVGLYITLITTAKETLALLLKEKNTGENRVYLGWCNHGYFHMKRVDLRLASEPTNIKIVSLQTYPASFRFLLFNNPVLMCFIWPRKLTIQVSGVNSDNRHAICSLSPEWRSIHHTVSPFQATVAALKAEVDLICVLWNIPQHRFSSGMWLC